MTLLKIPEREFRLGEGAELSAITNTATVIAGDVVDTTDSENWGEAALQSPEIKGVVQKDPTFGPGPFASGTMVTVRVTGIAVVRSTAAVIAVGDLVEVGASGVVRAYVLGADTNTATLEKVLGKALTSVGAGGGKLLVVLAGAQKC